MPLSKFIVEHVNNSLRYEIDDGQPSRAKLVIENNLHKGEVKNLKEDLALKRRQIMRYDRDIQRYQAEAHLNPEFEGVRYYHEKLVELFTDQKFIRSTDLNSILKVEPTDGKTIKSINVQIAIFESSGLIKRVSGGWRWQN